MNQPLSSLFLSLLLLGCAGVTEDASDDGFSEDDGGGGGTDSGGGSASGGRGLGVGGRAGPGAGGRSGGVGGGSSGSGGAASGDSGGSGSGPKRKKFVGNITTDNRMDHAGKKFASYWDQVTPENAGKWGSVQPNVGSQPNWSTLDSIYDYAEQNGLIFKQHVFIWGNQQPNGVPNESDVRAWISGFCSRYKNTKVIDVVNEPPPHTTPNYTQNISAGASGSWPWIVNAFKWARESCGDAILLLNDYNNIEWDDEVDHFISIAKDIKANGAPIDAVGAQAHDCDHPQMTTARVQANLRKLHEETGLPVHITEYDVSFSSDAEQLKYYQEQFPFFYETDWIEGITIWGWVRGRTWSQAPDSGLIDGNTGAPRPAMTWLMDYLGRPSP